MFLLFSNAKIALIADTSQHHESMAYDLNQGYSSAKVSRDQVPTDYDIFREGNLYQLEVMHNNWRG